jgi:hypothetical protein
MPDKEQDFTRSKVLRMSCHLNLLNANATLQQLAQSEEGISGLEMRILALTEEYLGAAR